MVADTTWAPLRSRKLLFAITATAIVAVNKAATMALQQLCVSDVFDSDRPVSLYTIAFVLITKQIETRLKVVALVLFEGALNIRCATLTRVAVARAAIEQLSGSRGRHGGAADRRLRPLARAVSAPAVGVRPAVQVISIVALVLST